MYKLVVKYILKSKSKFFLYSGYPGYVIKNKILLKKKKFLHAHPGKLPDYKGSTTLFYSILKSNKVYCTTMLLNDKIDEGKKINQIKYKIKCNNIKNFEIYDANIRAKTLYDAFIKIKMGEKIFKKIKNKSKNNYYFVAHPIIRYLAKNKICN